MNVNIELLRENAKLPAKSHDNDYCYDCFVSTVEKLDEHTYKYGLGFRYEIEGNGMEKDYSICLSVRPRSSIYKKRFVLSNSVGTLDYDYRGEVSVIFYHLTDEEPYNIGDKICQMHLDIAPKMRIVRVDKVDTDTCRGDGGFGSTGIK